MTLSTDDPLIMHKTEEPLIEEYSFASQVFNLSQVDLAEIALRSVQHSSFENVLKKMWIGQKWDKKEVLKHEGLSYEIPDLEANDYDLTNVSPIRNHYRISTLKEEYKYLFALAKDYSETTRGKGTGKE